jgi:hypothetical protein
MGCRFAKAEANATIMGCRGDEYVAVDVHFVQLFLVEVVAYHRDHRNMLVADFGVMLPVDLHAPARIIGVNRPMMDTEDMTRSGIENYISLCHYLPS